MERRKSLEIPKNYVKRLILLPLLTGILLVNAIIIATVMFAGYSIFSAATEAFLYSIAGLEILLILFYLYFALKSTHHMAGPMRAVERTLTQIGDGNLTATLQFRKGDFRRLFRLH